MTHIKSIRTSVGTRWMITYASLITALLAFFIFFVFSAEEAVQSKFKIADRLKKNIHERLLSQKDTNGLYWLHIENTVTKGVKLLIPSSLIDPSVSQSQISMFDSGDDQIKSEFLPYLKTIADILNSLEIETIPVQYAETIEYLHNIGMDLKIDVVIEGHTDRRPILTKRFKNNWSLSLARASNVMSYFQKNMNLPAPVYSLAGYGSFHPLHDRENLEENRRVEIYINIQMVPMNGKQ